MKPESLVTVDQLCHGEYVLVSCTHLFARLAALKTRWWKSIPRDKIGVAEKTWQVKNREVWTRGPEAKDSQSKKVFSTYTGVL